MNRRTSPLLSIGIMGALAASIPRNVHMPKEYPIIVPEPEPERDVMGRTAKEREHDQWCHDRAEAKRQRKATDKAARKGIKPRPTV